ncbi:MAG: hypothetical protein JSS39_09795 [Nitrospira sp.]|nr:hypothetical protein [Nitrospira sp.]
MGIHGTEPAPATPFISLSFLIHARFKIRPQLSAITLVGLWFVYRIILGWITLNDGRPMYV